MISVSTIYIVFLILFLHADERTLATEDKLEYNFEPLYGDTFTFKVAADHDAHLSFTMGPEETELMYEVFIGGWENQNSAIRRCKGNAARSGVLKVLENL